MILLWNYNISAFLITILISISLLPPPTSGGVTNKIDKEFKKKIDSAPAGSTWNINVFFKTDPNLQTTLAATLSNIKEPHLKGYEAVKTLGKYATESQAQVIQMVEKFNRKLQFKSLYSNNNLAIRSAGKDLLYLLGVEGKPETENITEIIEDKPFPLAGLEPQKNIEVLMRKEGRKQQGRQYGLPNFLAWGLETIKAQVWWEAGYNGTGVIVGHLDSGADVRHPSLKWNWFGKGEGWLDPGSKENKFPYEANQVISHGTHTLGTAVGWGDGRTTDKKDVDVFGVGVAPGARWISCAACREWLVGKILLCLPTHLQECGQFLNCPNEENRCENKPHVITVSLGCPQYFSYECPGKKKDNYPYDTLLNLWTMSGIIPVFAAGNNAAINGGCETINDPADAEEVISVGNVDNKDYLSADSALGPPKWRYNLSESESRKIFKPDLVAPGTNVYSTIYTGPAGKFEYGFLNGTSQAAPHVAGAIALLLSRNEGLTFQKVKQILFNTTRSNDFLRSTNVAQKCGGRDDFELMNYKFGYGRLELPNPKDPILGEERIPTRKMPPPPDYSDLADNSTPPSVMPGMVGVVIMAGITFLMNVLMEREIQFVKELEGLS